MIDVQPPTKRARLTVTENKEDVAQVSLTAKTGKQTSAQMMFPTNSRAQQQVSYPSWQSKYQNQRKTEESNTTTRVPYQAYQKNRFNAPKPRGRGRPRGSFNRRGYGQAERRYGCFGCGETTHGIKYCPNSNQQGQQRQRGTIQNQPDFNNFFKTAVTWYNQAQPQIPWYPPMPGPAPVMQQPTNQQTYQAGQQNTTQNPVMPFVSQNRQGN